LGVIRGLHSDLLRTFHPRPEIEARRGHFQTTATATPARHESFLDSACGTTLHRQFPLLAAASTRFRALGGLRPLQAKADTPFFLDLCHQFNSVVRSPSTREQYATSRAAARHAIRRTPIHVKTLFSKTIAVSMWEIRSHEITILL
jgi:hypothetical protein